MIQDSLRNIKMGGKFTAELINDKTGEIEGKFFAKNVVLDVAYQAMAGGFIPAQATIIAVGTGSNTPLSSDVGLQTQIAQSGGTFERITDYSWKVIAYFETGQANGSLRELGAKNNTHFLNRALFKDDQDSPITIVKSSLQLLKVTMEFEIVRI